MCIYVSGDFLGCNFMFNFLRNWQTIFQSICTTLQTYCEKSIGFLIFPLCLQFLFYDFKNYCCNHPREYRVTSYYGFKSYFPNGLWNMSRVQTECALNGEIQTSVEKQASKQQKNPQGRHYRTWLQSLSNIWGNDLIIVELVW